MGDAEGATAGHFFPSLPISSWHSGNRLLRSASGGFQLVDDFFYSLGRFGQADGTALLLDVGDLALKADDAGGRHGDTDGGAGQGPIPAEAQGDAAIGGGIAERAAHRLPAVGHLAAGAGGDAVELLRGFAADAGEPLGVLAAAAARQQRQARAQPARPPSAARVHLRLLPGPRGSMP